MSERPGPGGSADRPDFDWLYGKKGAAGENPDATRAIPVQPRPDAGRPGSDPRNGPRNGPPNPDDQHTQVMSTGARPERPYPADEQVRPAPTPQQPPQQPPGPPRAPKERGGSGGGFWARRARRPRFWIRLVIALFALWLLYTVAVPFIAWQKGDPVAFEPDGDRPGDQPGTTYLMVGSDSRANLSAEERKKYHTGNPESELTDTIMLLHTGAGPNVLLSIPRDSIVDIPGSGESKINSAYGRGGAKLLTEVIEKETGIRVDEYVEIGLGGVAGVVDAVGGVEICPKERMKDPLAGLNVKKGCQEADGATALAYSRSRKQSALGDLDRVRRQREVVSAIGDKVISPWSVVNPVRWWKLNNSVPEFFAFGDGTGKFDAAKWALAMTKVDGTDGLTCTMPVTDLSANNWDMDRAGPLFDAIKEDRTDDITKKQCTPSGIVQ